MVPALALLWQKVIFGIPKRGFTDPVDLNVSK